MIDRTPTGFRWHDKDVQPLDVDRFFWTETHRVVRITCGGQHIDVYVSPTGRSMRVFKGGNEMKEDDRG